jgi:hypothetical protein
MLGVYLRKTPKHYRVSLLERRSMILYRLETLVMP